MKRLTQVEFTNLNKILYPTLKIKKSQIIKYYIKTAPKMLTLLAKRPLALTRYPNGIDQKGFYEKDAPPGTPSWVDTFKRYSETAQRDVNYILCNNLDTLVWLANLATLEIHIALSRADSFDSPDLILFDLDPEPPANIDTVVDVALLLKEKLETLNLKSYVKTSGKRGLHVILPIIKGYTFSHTRNFVQQLRKKLAKESEIILPESSRLKTPGTVLIDYAQNSHGKTMICPYSLRATPQATVSTPVEWGDIKKGLKPENFNFFTVSDLEENPWEKLLQDKQRLEVN